MNKMIKKITSILSRDIAKQKIKENLRKSKKRITDRNYRFSKLTPAKQRVTIAKDVISLLKAEKIIAETGSYLKFGGNTAFDEIRWSRGLAAAEKTKVHKVIEATPKCTACGIGACFVASVLRADKVVVGDMHGESDDRFMRKYLGKWFDLPQLRLIEAAFEIESRHANKAAGAMAAERFGRRFCYDKDRLTGIMENIIDNDGEFKP